MHLPIPGHCSLISFSSCLSSFFTLCLAGLSRQSLLIVRHVHVLVYISSLWLRYFHITRRLVWFYVSLLCWRFIFFSGNVLELSKTSHFCVFLSFLYPLLRFIINNCIRIFWRLEKKILLTLNWIQCISYSRQASILDSNFYIILICSFSRK